MIECWQESHDNLLLAADALQSLLSGEDSPEAGAGAILLAEGLAAIRAIAVGSGIWRR